MLIFSARDNENQEANHDKLPELKDTRKRKYPRKLGKRKYLPKLDPSPKECQCDICKSVLPSRRGLLNHMRSKHMGGPIMSYSCPECQKRFRDKSSWTNHLRCHTDERPYICEVKFCRSAFLHGSIAYINQMKVFLNVFNLSI